MNILIIVIFSSIFIFASADYCEPDEEFENGETSEWKKFMDKIYELIFDTPRKKPCVNDFTREVVLDVNSDFLWDLRFTVYNERQNTEEKTIEQCYKAASNQTGDGACNIPDFQQCMKNARTSMFNEITSSWWEGKIQEELQRMAEKC